MCQNPETFGKKCKYENVREIKCNGKQIPSQRYICRPKKVRGTKCKSENVREIKCNRKIATGGGEMCVRMPFACCLLLFVVVSLREQPKTGSAGKHLLHSVCFCVCVLLYSHFLFRTTKKNKKQQTNTTFLTPPKNPYILDPNL